MSRSLHGGLENFLQDKIFPDLERGRPGDKAHTLLVVFRLKAVAEHSPDMELDLDVLVIAAYAHDWGYAGLFDNKAPLRLAELGAQKDAHMLIGAQKLTNLLKDPFFHFLTKDQKQRAVHLVSVHDKLGQLNDSDELILMEADSLAGMEPDIMGGFADEASEERFMRKSRDKRLSRFITSYGKVEFERLFEKRKNYSGQKS